MNHRELSFTNVFVEHIFQFYVFSCLNLLKKVILIFITLYLRFYNTEYNDTCMWTAEILEKMY